MSTAPTSLPQRKRQRAARGPAAVLRPKCVVLSRDSCVRLLSVVNQKLYTVPYVDHQMTSIYGSLCRARRPSEFGYTC
jgi:hypothetical protein